MATIRDATAALGGLTDLLALSDGLHETLVVRAPFTDAEIARIPLAGGDDLDAAVAEGRRAQAAWSAAPVEDRCRIILRFRQLLLQERERVLDVLQLETGKARRHAFEELADVAFVTAYYARAAGRLLKPRRRRGALPGLTRTVEYRHPHGVVAVIAPWNYPLVLSISDAIPAVLAGNAVVIKPDVQTTHTALTALSLLRAAGLPAAVFQVVPGTGPEAGGGLVDRADYVSFTGSTATGREVARRAAGRLVGCSLELGGKNPMIVRADADLGRAVDGAVRGSFSNAGQLCIATERLYVEASMFDRFVEAFAERAAGLKLGADFDYSADMGSLTHVRQLQKVEEHVDDAVRLGARVLAGGRARPDIGPLFYEPTVLAGVTPDMRLASEETFGPVVAAYPFGTDEEAIRLANDSCYGLNASVWSRDARRAWAMARRIQAGTVNVNEAYSAAWGSIDAPMGGRQDSGTGRRHGAEGLLKYTQSQTIALQRGLPLDAAGPWLERRRAHAVALALLRRFRPGPGRGRA